MIKNEKFHYNGKEFDVRVSEIDGKYCVKVFSGDVQVSPVYSVDLEANQDFFVQYKENFVEQLVAIAKSDITNGIYCKP